MSYKDLLDELEDLVDTVYEALLDETTDERGRPTNEDIRRFGEIAEGAKEHHRSLGLRRMLFS